MKQHFNRYTEEDQFVWNTLFARQYKNLKGKASKTYIHCLDEMNAVLHPHSIPNFSEIDDWFKDKTAWSIHVVPGLIPVRDFFALLAEKKFCSSTWLRKRSQLDYLEEPDMFHDIFGHIPLLSDKNFSSFAQKFGELGCKVSHDENKVLKLQRLYWFSIEFGLIQEDNIHKAYGAGIISSFGELNRIAKAECSILPFNIQKVLLHDFRTDVMQEEYFTIQSIEELGISLESIQATFH